MPEQHSSSARTAVLVIIATVAAFLLLKLWMWTAQFPWSSDAWLELFPAAIAASGYFAAALLVVILFVSGCADENRFRRVYCRDVACD